MTERLRHTIIYRSGAAIDVFATELVVAKRDADITSVEWSDDIQPRPLHLGVDDIAAIYVPRRPRRRMNSLHVHRQGTTVERAILRDPKGNELDLTPWKIIEIQRVIKPHDLPVTEVAFVAILVEHDQDTTAYPGKETAGDA